MDNTVVQIISTLGFPIAMCIGACVFIKYQFDSNNKNMDELRKEVEKMTTAITNNTIALTKLIEKLDK